MGANKICYLNCLHFLSTCTKQETLFVTQSWPVAGLHDAAAAGRPAAVHSGTNLYEMVCASVTWQLIFAHPG